MRNWVLALVFLNLAFFAYTRLVSDRAVTPPGAESGGTVPQLHLVDEMRDRPGRRCTSVGAFDGRTSAEQGQALLAAATRISQLRSAEVADAPLYSVSATTPTLQPAISIAARLRAAGVRDLEVVPPGAGAPQAVVSFGSFGDRDHAARRVAELKRYAVNASVLEQARAHTEWWVDIEQQAGDAPIDATAAGAALQPPVQVVAVPCPAAATATPVAVPPTPADTAPPAATPAAAPEAAPASAPATAPAAAPAIAPANTPDSTAPRAPGPVGGPAKPAVGKAQAPSTRRAVG